MEDTPENRKTLEKLRQLVSRISGDSPFAQTLLASSGPPKWNTLQDVLLTLSDFHGESASSEMRGWSLGCSSIISVVMPVLILLTTVPIYQAIGAKLPPTPRLGLQIMIAYGLAGIALAIVTSVIARLPKYVVREGAIGPITVALLKMTGLWEERVAFARWKLAMLTAVWLVPNRLYVETTVPADVRSALTLDITAAMDREAIAAPPFDSNLRSMRWTQHVIYGYAILGFAAMTAATMLLKVK